MEGTQEEPSLTARAIFAGVLIAASTAFTNSLSAQGSPEFRIDGFFAKTSAVHAGIGVLFPLGTYVRTGIVGGAGIADNRASFRADLVNIFHLDPFRESRWAPYGGGGFSFRHDDGGDGLRSLLLVFLGVEGPPRKGFAPAFELGLSGGARAGVVLRQARGRNR